MEIINQDKCFHLLCFKLIVFLVQTKNKSNLQTNTVTYLTFDKEKNKLFFQCLTFSTSYNNGDDVKSLALFCCESYKTFKNTHIIILSLSLYNEHSLNWTTVQPGEIFTSTGNVCKVKVRLRLNTMLSINRVHCTMKLIVEAFYITIFIDSHNSEKERK